MSVPYVNHVIGAIFVCHQIWEPNVEAPHGSCGWRCTLARWTQQEQLKYNTANKARHTLWSGVAMRIIVLCWRGNVWKMKVRAYSSPSLHGLLLLYEVKVGLDQLVPDSHIYMKTNLLQCLQDIYLPLSRRSQVHVRSN